jgi:hypothetical protein
MESYQKALERARQKGACTSALKEVEQLHDWDEFFGHTRAPEWCYWYARNVLRGRWPEAEPAIAQNPEWAYWYAHNILRGRFPEGEPAIATSPYLSYWYGKYIIHGQFPSSVAGNP